MEKVGRPLHSNVLLRLHGDISEEAIAGVSIQDYHSPWNCMSVEATVEAISDGFVFMGPEMERMRKSWGPDVRSVADLCSLRYDVPIEVKVGDTVIFDWRMALDDADKAYRIAHDLLVVSYSDLIARVDAGSLHPLNGLVFAVSEETDQLIAARDARGDKWRVIAEGSRIRRHLDDILPEQGWPPLVGRTVFCDPRTPIAVEAPLFSKYDYSGKRFHIFFRHQIVAFT